MIIALASFSSAREPVAPGLHDVVVYDPGKHPRGLPKVEFQRSGDGLTIDIPPAVHVHRFYYSGDKEIQGPIIQGGPTVVVANHPKTQKRLYLDVTLPGGAPRIAYNKKSITYIYPNQRVSIRFSHLPFCEDRVSIKYHSGRGVGRVLAEKTKRLTQHTKGKLKDSQLIQSVTGAASGAGELVVGVGEAAGGAGSKLLQGAGQVLEVIPGVATLKSYAKQRPSREQSRGIEQAAAKKARKASSFLPTNR